MITPSFSITATERVLPKLALDFTTASLDSRITFTRTTDATHPATYINSVGYVTSATNNQPRFDYDPIALTCKGLLIEESRTNTITYSNDLSQAVWAKNQVTVPTAAITAPDGSASVYKMQEDTTNDAHYLDIRPTVTAGVNSVSVYVKAAGRTKFQMREGSKGQIASFDLNNPAGSAGNIQALGNGWYRCWIQATPAATTFIFQLRLLDNSGNLIYTGDGSSGLYVWGAQVETGTFVTSVIPTSGSALTRNADVATMTGTNFSNWFNASEGCIQIQVNTRNLGGTIYPGWFAIDNNTVSNEVLTMFAYNTELTSLSRTSSTNVFVYTKISTVPTTPSVIKAALSYKNSNYIAAYQGTSPSQQLSGAVPTGLVQMRIGSYNNRQINGHIQKINYWPQALQPAEVQTFSK